MNSIKSFCINLSNREDRYIQTCRELLSSNIIPERFIVNEHTINSKIKRSDLQNEYKSNQILESHIKLLSFLYEKFKDDYFLILEDDIKVVKNFNLNDIISKIEFKWDVLYLGGLNHYHDKPPEIIDETFYECKYAFNAHAYLIKRQFIPKLLQQLSKKEFEVDVIYARCQENKIGRWCGLIEDVIIQNGLESPTFISTFKINRKVLERENVSEIRKFNKIFQIGFNKCGTTSIHATITDAGLNSVHWNQGLIAEKMHLNYTNGYKLLYGIEQYDCYTDIENVDRGLFPFIAHYKLLNEQYPNSVFILNTRPIDKWIISRKKHPNYIQAYKEALNLKTEKQVIEHWVYTRKKHHAHVIKYFEGKSNFIKFNIETEPHSFIDFLRKWGIPAKKFMFLHKTNG